MYKEGLGLPCIFIKYERVICVSYLKELSLLIKESKNNKLKWQNEPINEQKQEVEAPKKTRTPKKKGDK